MPGDYYPASNPVAQESEFVFAHTSRLLVKRLAFGAAAQNGNTVLAAVTGAKIRVLALDLTANGTVALYFNSGASGTVIWGDSTTKIPLVVNSRYTLPPNPWGWFETAKGALLEIFLSANVGVSGGLLYCEVPA